MKGEIGWAGIAIGVGVFDVLNDETMTHAYQEALKRNKVSRAIAIGGMAITCSHLLGILPRQVDPFYAIMDGVKRASGESDE